jgi:hypothetical protein
MQPIRIYPEYALILTYDIRQGVQERYFRYVTGEFVPALQQRKIYMQNAWHIVYGEQPERQVEFVTEDLSIIQNLFDDPEWKELEGKLESFIRNYTKRIVKYRGVFKL